MIEGITRKCNPLFVSIGFSFVRVAWPGRAQHLGSTLPRSSALSAGRRQSQALPLAAFHIPVSAESPHPAPSLLRLPCFGAATALRISRVDRVGRLTH